MTPFITTIWAIFAGLIVLFLPGLAWLSLFRDPEQDAFERLAEVIGISISITALLALFAFIFNWSLSSIILIVFYILLFPPAIWAMRHWWLELGSGEETTSLLNESPRNEKTKNYLIGNWQNFSHKKLRYIILVLIFLSALLWRFYQIRDIVLPLWVDSIHHVQIVRLIIENGGLPNTFEPYMPVPFYYHFAFHALAAVYAFLARLSPQDAVLYLGQVLNAAIVLAVYRLGKSLWGDWRRAALSSLLVAFVTQMPAYYVSWGRYTLLMGMLLLPLAMALALDIINKGARFSRLISLSVVTAGLLLSHYYAGLLLALFLIILGAQSLIVDVKHKNFSRWESWLPLLLASVAGFLLASPWLFRMWGFAQAGVKVVTIQPTIEAIERLYFPDYFNYLWRLLGPDRNHLLLLIALPGLIISLLHYRTRAFGVWTIILGILSFPVGVYLAPFRPDHAVIVLFLPTAMMVAELFISAIDWSPIKQFTSVKSALVIILFGALIMWGIWGTRSLVNSTTILATHTDLAAINWIKSNLPQEARFLINVAHWQYGSYRGVDGGWWITPLSGRMTSLPNALSAMGSAEYVQQVNQSAVKVSQIEGCTLEFWEMVRESRLTHIYLTQTQGSIRPDHLDECSGVELIYDVNGVYLFRIKDIINGDP
jgi:hypothetical protein